MDEPDTSRLPSNIDKLHGIKGGLPTATEANHQSISEKFSPRGKILYDAIIATEGDKNKSYGDPLFTLGLAGKLKQLCREYAVVGRTIGPAELEALDMVLTKIARVFTGGIFSRDTYLDGAAYFAIAGELAEKEAGPHEKPTPEPDFKK